MADPAVLIPSGLRAVHPQLEESLKSIDGAIRNLRQRQGASSTSGGVADASVAALRQQVLALQQQVTALQGQISALNPATVYRAAAMLPAYVAVYEAMPEQLAVADDGDASTSYAVVGITTAAATQGAVVQLAGNGETLSNPAWAWAVSQTVFADAGGGLTQSPPSVGFTAPVGVAVSATAMLVAVGEPAGFAVGNTDALIGRSAMGGLNAQWLPLLPSLNAIAAGNTVTVPAFCNLLTASSSGLVLDGDLILDGDFVEART